MSADKREVSDSRENDRRCLGKVTPAKFRLKHVIISLTYNIAFSYPQIYGNLCYLDDASIWELIGYAKEHKRYDIMGAVVFNGGSVAKEFIDQWQGSLIRRLTSRGWFFRKAASITVLQNAIKKELFSCGKLKLTAKALLNTLTIFYAGITYCPDGGIRDALKGVIQAFLSPSGQRGGYSVENDIPRNQPIWLLFIFDRLFGQELHIDHGSLLAFTLKTCAVHRYPENLIRLLMQSSINIEGLENNPTVKHVVDEFVRDKRWAKPTYARLAPYLTTFLPQPITYMVAEYLPPLCYGRFFQQQSTSPLYGEQVKRANACCESFW